MVAFFQLPGILFDLMHWVESSASYLYSISPPSLRNSIRTLSSPGALHFFISVRAFLTSSLVMSGT